LLIFQRLLKRERCIWGNRADFKTAKLDAEFKSDVHNVELLHPQCDCPK